MIIPMGEHDIDQIIKIVENAGVPSCSITRSHSGIKVTFPRALTQGEKDAIKKGILKLQHTGADAYDPDRIRDLTPTQIDNWIDNNVTDLNSAKVALKKITRAVLFLYKRLEVDIIG